MKKRTITLISVIGIVAIALVILFTTGTLPKNNMEGTIVKTSKYRKQQTKVGDIILSPDILKDTTQGRQLAINLIQLSYITESIADQTDEIIKRVEATSITDHEKNDIITPLNNYRDMVVTNMNLMRNSSKNILAFIDNNEMEMTEDIDKNFQDIGGFFNRYKTDNNVFTTSIITLEKLVVTHDTEQQEGPSDFEIIRDKLYTVAFQNANFLQEKELKKELLEKILAETEPADNTDLTSDDKSIIVYNDEENAFQVINKNSFDEIDTKTFNKMASTGALQMYNSSLGAILIVFNQSEINTLLFSESSALEMQSETMDATILQSMAIGSMAKYSGLLLMNTNDLKSILNADQLSLMANSPFCSLSKESMAQLEELNIFGNITSLEAKNMALGLSLESGAKATEGMNLVNAAEAINLVNATEGMNFRLEMSTLGFHMWINADMKEAINSLLGASALQYMAAGNQMQAVNLTGTFDMQSGIFSQIGLDFLPGDLGLMMSLKSQDMLSAYGYNGLF